MSRPLDPKIRSELLSQSLEICVRVGLKGLSLRALAQELGTSHRMLIYHFGSAEQMFQAVIHEFRSSQVANFEDEFRQVAEWAEFTEATKRCWHHLTSDENRHVMLLSLEIQLDAIRQGHTRASSDYLQAASEDWIAPIKATLLRIGRPEAESRLVGRTIASCGRGLILDLLAAEDETDKAEVRSAFDRLIDRL